MCGSITVADYSTIAKGENMDSAKLKDIISQSGLKQGYLANYLGISRYCLIYKLNGEVEFKPSEIRKLREKLNINAKDTIDIFLRN